VLTETNIQGTYDISTYDIIEYIDIHKYIHGFVDSCKYMMQHSYDAHKRAPHSTRIKVQAGRQAGMIGFITLQQSAPSQMTWQDSNTSRKH
jgi:hypothetical protein